MWDGMILAGIIGILVGILVTVTSAGEPLMDHHGDEVAHGSES